MGAMSRRKGSRGERELAEALRVVFPGAKRGLSQSRGGREVPDVEGCTPFWIESKRQRRPNIPAALEQAIADRDASGDPTMLWPVAVTQADRAEKLVTMRLTDFVELLTEWRTYERAVLEHAKRDALAAASVNVVAPAAAQITAGSYASPVEAAPAGLARKLEEGGG